MTGPRAVSLQAPEAPAPVEEGAVGCGPGGTPAARGAVPDGGSPGEEADAAGGGRRWALQQVGRAQLHRGLGLQGSAGRSLTLPPRGAVLPWGRLSTAGPSCLHRVWPPQTPLWPLPCLPSGRPCSPKESLGSRGASFLPPLAVAWTSTTPCWSLKFLHLPGRVLGVVQAVFLLRSLGRHPAPARSEPAAHRGLRASSCSGRPQPTPPCRGAGRRWPEAAPAWPCVRRPLRLSCSASSEPPALGRPSLGPSGESGCLGQGRLAAASLRFTPAAAAGGWTGEHLTSSHLWVCLELLAALLSRFQAAASVSCRVQAPQPRGRQGQLSPCGPQHGGARPVASAGPGHFPFQLEHAAVPCMQAWRARPLLFPPSGGFHSQFSEAKLGLSGVALERLPSPPAAWPPQFSALTVARMGGPGQALVGAGQPRGPWRPRSLQCAGRSPGSRAWLARGWQALRAVAGGLGHSACARPAHRSGVLEGGF